MPEAEVTIDSQTSAANEPAAPSPRWFAANPGKAWSEKWFLLYSPVWMAAMAAMMLGGVDEHFGDLGFVLWGLLMAVPFVAVPAMLSPENAGRRWYQTFWFKANLYMAIFGFFGNYFGSEYFFDVLGMVYDYPTISWHLDAALVGHGAQSVPVVMYLLTHAYFMTYHNSAVVVLRRIRTAGVPGMVLLFPLSIFVVGYFWAWMETRAMANPLIAENFYYQNMGAMLAYGSIFYALYFVGSFPIYYFLDEDADRPWDLRTTVFAALGASMIVFYLLDFSTAYIGSI